MSVSVAHRASRDLGTLPNYRHLDGSSVPAYLAQAVTLSPDETIVGIYHNYPDRLDEAILVTDVGIYLLSSIPKFVPYATIQSVRPYTTDKTQMVEGPASRQIVIDLGKDDSVIVPVIGSEGRLLDMTQFLGFLLGVAGDIRDSHRDVRVR